MPFVSSGQAENAAMLCSGGSGNVAANFDIELTSLAVSPVRGCPIVCRSQDILERHPDHRNLTIRQIERSTYPLVSIEESRGAGATGARNQPCFSIKIENRLEMAVR
jgi:hypothetical protein